LEERLTTNYTNGEENNMKREWNIVECELTYWLNRNWPGQDLFIVKMRKGTFEIRSWSNRDKQESFKVLSLNGLYPGASEVKQLEKILGKRSE